MEHYRNFKLAAYVYAYYLEGKSVEQVQADIDAFREVAPLDKVYLETHRALVDIPADQMRLYIDVFRKNGIEVSGGITTTVKVGERKPSLFDTFCFSDPAHRERMLEIVRTTASLFDEMILDDYFFTACRCEKCIEKKGQRSWADFRLDLLADMSREMVREAKKVNPKVNFIIKYPNWYESFQENGYNPEAQKDIYDMIYTGTETRLGRYDGQHLQRYLSYGLMRLMDNTAPGRNGGGWIDLGGSSANLSVWLQQADYTMFAGGKALPRFHGETMLHTPALAALGAELRRVDAIVAQLGTPEGACMYEPHNADGEDQLLGYLGLCGLSLEPKPTFDDKAKVLLLTANSAYDPQVIEKLEKYVREGGVAIVTSGFVKQTADAIRQMTSVSPTDRKITGTRYQITSFNVSTGHIHQTDTPITFTMMQHKNNATWYDVLLHAGEFSTPIMTEDYYGKGYLYILNIPDNFSDLYRLPREVWGAIGKNFARGGKLYLSAPSQYSLFQYDNDTFGVFNLNEMRACAELVLLGEEYIGFEDIETGERFSASHHSNPLPGRKGDSATCRPEPLERVFELSLMPGAYRFYRLIKA